MIEKIRLRELLFIVKLAENVAQSKYLRELEIGFV